jgi:LAGLIDADG DNA endonuclease family/Cytochrome C oxidase subunit II, transmembrane domain
MTLIELIWTVGPALVLVAIAFPSFKLLYLMDEVIDPAMTVKVTGFFMNIRNICLILLARPIGTGNLYPSRPHWGRGGLNFFKYLKNGGLNSYMLCLNKFYSYNEFFKKRFLFISKNFHTLVKANKRIGPHNEDIISAIIGSLLGDGYGNKRYIEGTRFCFRQSIIHKEYLFWIFQFFNERGYCSNLEPRIYTRSLKNKGIIKEYYGYEFNTYTFRSFDWIYKMFYKDGKKRIHSNLVYFLTPLALAIWISDDGCWVKNGVRISCNAFTLKEVEFLIEILYKNFSLISNSQKTNTFGQYSIYIQSKSIPKLRKIVSPFIHNSMLYKLGM